MANIYENTNTKKLIVPKTTVVKPTVTKSIVTKPIVPKLVMPNIWEPPTLKTVVKKTTAAAKTTTPKTIVPTTTTTKTTTPKTTVSKTITPKIVIPETKDLSVDKPKKDDTKKDKLKKEDTKTIVGDPVLETVIPETGDTLTMMSDSPQIDIEARINALNQAKQDQAVADLGKSRDTQLSNLTGEESAIKPLYYDKRNTTAASNMMGRRSLAEELAARGETKSGVADQANITANMSLQGETGALNRQESADISDIARRRTGVNNAYESDVTSARANLEAVAMQNLIDQYNTDREFKLSESGVTGTYNGNSTLDAINANRNFGLNEANVTGTYNGNETLASKGQTFDQNMTTKQFNEDVKQQKLDNLYRGDIFDYQKSRDAVGDSQWQKTMNLDLRKQTFDETQAQISNALASKRISQDDASQSLQWAKFNAEQDPNSLDNQYKKAQIDGLTTKTNTSTGASADDYASTINSLYVVKPNVSNGYKGSMNTVGIKTYLDKLISSGVDDSVVDSLATRYGL